MFDGPSWVHPVGEAVQGEAGVELSEAQAERSSSQQTISCSTTEWVTCACEGFDRTERERDDGGDSRVILRLMLTKESFWNVGMGCDSCVLLKKSKRTDQKYRVYERQTICWPVFFQSSVTTELQLNRKRKNRSTADSSTENGPCTFTSAFHWTYCILRAFLCSFLYVLQVCLTPLVLSVCAWASVFIHTKTLSRTHSGPEFIMENKLQVLLTTCGGCCGTYLSLFCFARVVRPQRHCKWTKQSVSLPCKVRHLSGFFLAW